MLTMSRRCLTTHRCSDIDGEGRVDLDELRHMASDVYSALGVDALQWLPGADWHTDSHAWHEYCREFGVRAL